MMINLYHRHSLKVTRIFYRGLNIGKIIILRDGIQYFDIQLIYVKKRNNISQPLWYDMLLWYD